MSVIKVRNLNKTFGDLHILKGIDLTIAEGEVVVIIGPSGSGKSTLLRCLNFLEIPDEGSEIYIDGQLIDPAKDNLDKVREKMGMVFQHFNLFPHKNVLNNITVAPENVKKVPRSKAKAIARDLLAKVGLSDREKAWPSQLSGGQKQRVAIARALAMEPEIMLFDEVTSALDPELVAVSLPEPDKQGPDADPVFGNREALHLFLAVIQVDAADRKTRLFDKNFQPCLLSHPAYLLAPHYTAFPCCRR